MPSITECLADAMHAITSDSARIDAERLLAHALNKPVSYLYSWPEYTLNPEQQHCFSDYTQRRKMGEPVAYIIQEQGFWNDIFHVTTDTLIPRPETELLVEYVLDNTSPSSTDTLCDLGTGTGCIGISIAKERPNMRITLVDQSQAALNVAKGNASRLSACNVETVHSNWLDAFDAEQQRFDWIVSNPPYIEEHDPHLTQGDVNHEPRSALTSGKTGLDDIRIIQNSAKKHLSNNGHLLLEFGYNQSDRVTEMLSQSGYRDIQTHYDYNRIIRAISASYSTQL